MGLYQSGSDATHCSFQISPSWATLNYNAYPVSATEAFLIQVDSPSVTPYISTLDLKQQSGYPFLTQGVFSSSLAGGLSGQFLSSAANLLPEAEIVQISPTSNGAFNLLWTDNTAGSVFTNMQTPTAAPAPISVSYSSDQFGRIQPALQAPYQPVLYLVSSDEAFIMSITGGNPFPIIVGHLDPQSVPKAPGFSTAYLSGNFVEGSIAPAASTTTNVSGYFTLDGNGNITGTRDTSTTTANTATQAVAGTYNVLDIADGTGFVAPTPSVFAGEYVIVSPTKWVMITTTPGDTNPILTVFGH